METLFLPDVLGLPVPKRNPNRARVVAHLAKHKGETAEEVSKHLGYPLPTVYKYLRELEAAQLMWRRLGFWWMLPWGRMFEYPSLIVLLFKTGGTV